MTTDAQSARIAELERQVDQLKEQNASAMRELDAFAYAVSHDLRAPLRSLSGFSQALLEFDASDAGKTRHYLERIQQASRKLSELIDALLSISRVSRADMLCRELDFSKLCSDAAAGVIARYPGRTIQITVAPGLSAFGDPRLTRAAVESLLDNACKFSARQQTASIEVGQMPSGEFYIADNGAGFDPVYTEKLFKPFQRLHSDPQFSGLGVGLATVQRILARHGGRIRIEAKPDAGATAYFVLPNRSEQQPLTLPQGTSNDPSS
jgi:signal transduction histidine kinase